MSPSPQAGHHGTGSAGEQEDAADYEEPLLQQRDKLFGMNMKKYILMSLGLGNIPGTKTSCSKSESYHMPAAR